MTSLLTIALAGASLLAGVNPETEYVNAFERSVQTGPQDAEHFLVGRLRPEEKGNPGELRTWENSLPGLAKPSAIFHRRALILIGGAKLDAMEKTIADYGSQHNRYSRVMKHSSLCSGDKTPFIFRWWTTPGKETIEENEATHEHAGPRYKIFSKLHGIRLSNEEDNAKSAGHPELDLCQLPPASGQQEFTEKWQFQDIRTVWRFEETSDGVYVETNSLAVIHPSGLAGVGSGLLKIVTGGNVDAFRNALKQLNDEMLRAMAQNPAFRPPR